MIFWIILISIIIYHLIKKRENTFYLHIAIYIFIFGALLNIVTLKDFSEFFMRISFTFFLIGLVLSYIGGGGAIKLK